MTVFSETTRRGPDSRGQAEGRASPIAKRRQVPPQHLKLGQGRGGGDRQWAVEKIQKVGKVLDNINEGIGMTF